MSEVKLFGSAVMNDVVGFGKELRRCETAAILLTSCEILFVTVICSSVIIAFYLFRKICLFFSRIGSRRAKLSAT